MWGDNENTSLVTLCVCNEEPHDACGRLVLTLYCLLQGKAVGCSVHPCTGTEALYRPYGP